MKTRKLIKLVPSLVLCACAVWAPPATADYKAVILDDGWGSRIYGVSSGDQVGIVDGHAAMWSGTAESYVDLNPTGFLYSEARGICGDQKVGWGRGSTTEGNNHALLWSGTPGTWVDLNPPSGLLSRGPTVSPAISRWAMGGEMTQNGIIMP